MRLAVDGVARRRDDPGARGQEGARDRPPERTGSTRDHGHMTFEAHRAERYRCSTGAALLGAERDGSLGIRRPAGPRARVERALVEARDAQGEQVVTRGDARATRRDDACALLHAARREAPSQLIRRQEAPGLRVEVLGPGRAAGARDVAGNRIDRRLDAREACERAGVEQRCLAAQRVSTSSASTKRSAGHSRAENPTAAGAAGSCSSGQIQVAMPPSSTYARTPIESSIHQRRAAIEPDASSYATTVSSSPIPSRPSAAAKSAGAGSGWRPTSGAAGAERSRSMSAQTAPGMWPDRNAS